MVATVTTPTYEQSVVSLTGVLPIIFVTVIILGAVAWISSIVPLKSNLHRISCQIRGSLNSVMSMVIAELSKKVYPFGQCVETRRQASDKMDGGIVQSSLKDENRWIIFGVNLCATRLRNLVKKLPEFGGKLRCQYRAKQQINNLWACVTTRGEVSPMGDNGIVWTMVN